MTSTGMKYSFLKIKFEGLTFEEEQAGSDSNIDYDGTTRRLLKNNTKNQIHDFQQVAMRMLSRVNTLMVGCDPQNDGKIY